MQTRTVTNRYRGMAEEVTAKILNKETTGWVTRQVILIQTGHGIDHEFIEVLVVHETDDGRFGSGSGCCT